LGKAGKSAGPETAAGNTASPRRLLWLGLAVAACVMLLDQASKWVVLAYAGDPGCMVHPVWVVPVLPFFNLTLVYNTGVTFGLGGDLGPLLLSGLAIAISVGLAVWLRTVDSLLLAIAIGGVIGGAIGNVIDRVRCGAVVDFLDFFVGRYHWPAFNLADSAIVVGVGLIIIDGLIAGREETK
jgi:signal peptidase II